MAVNFGYVFDVGLSFAHLSLRFLWRSSNAKRVGIELATSALVVVVAKVKPT